MATLERGQRGNAVRRLQAELCRAGIDCKPIDGSFGRGTERAVRRYQRETGLPQSGKATPRTQKALGFDKLDPAKIMVPILAVVDELFVARMFSIHTPRENIARFLPPIKDALAEHKLDDRDMVLMALATIRAESEGFEPIDESRSRFNTSTGGQPFDLYDSKRQLGNQGHPDGRNYKGRGFVQLTGRANYTRISRRLGLDDRLVDTPSLANDPVIAARVLAAFIKAKKSAIKYALYGGDLAYARRLVNGGKHGLDRFTAAFEDGIRFLPALDAEPPRTDSQPAELETILTPPQLLSPTVGTEILVDRFFSDDDATISRVSINGAFECFGLEDEYREEKVVDETRIPAGSYAVALRTEGGFHQRYTQRFGAMHRGMLHILNVPGFKWILIHIGNTDEDTAGCLLVGSDASTAPGNLRVTASKAAYERLYPKVVDAAAAGQLSIRFEDNDGF